MGKFIIVVAIAALLFAISRGNSGGKIEFPMRLVQGTTPVKTLPTDKKVRVILFTGTEWCPACVHLDGSVIATPAWKEFASKEIRFRAINIPADRSKASANDLKMAQQYNIRGYPTMLVLDSANEELSRQVGAGAPVENYKAWIRQHAQFY
jgi:thiol-disulfide isomerase/thioredoxin